jgi:AbrB family looped-hinge helix DNA binding protein
MEEVIQVAIDEQGRIVIPSTLQNRLGLKPGMVLIVVPGQEEGVLLNVQEDRPLTLIDKEGVLVVQTEPLADLIDVVAREREHRQLQLLQRVSP